MKENENTNDLYWCSEGCGFVDKDHRCEQWCHLSRIPEEAIKILYDKARKEERALIKEKELNEFRMDELDAVMLSVDKWLSGDKLKNNQATRASDAREIALQAIEKEAYYSIKKENVQDLLQEIADSAHFLRMELFCCGKTQRADEFCLSIRQKALALLNI